MIGKTVSCYRIIDKLGQGGMGEIYRARLEPNYPPSGRSQRLLPFR
jgi:serine/threonine protein kinase